jgi:O-acetyl-ADP-ribose deacetylase (regulator of RNase III)
VTGGGELPAAFAVHVVIADERGPGTREKIRRALVSAWQRAGDWGLRRLASPLVGVQAGSLTAAEAAELLVETFPNADEPGHELRIVVAPEDREAVEAIVRRTRA